MRAWLASLFRWLAYLLEPEAVEARTSALLAVACRLWTQGLGGEGAYYPTLGAVKTEAALRAMREAGVEPKWHSGQAETEEEA